MLEPIYIPRFHNQFPTKNHYLAWRGFDSLGHEIHFFEDSQLRFDLPPDAIVIGGVVEVERAFKKLSIQYSGLEAIPAELLPFAGRRLWKSTIDDVIDLTSAESFQPIFVKPLPDQHKLFPGKVISNRFDTLVFLHADSATPVLCSEVVQFGSEWRVFIHHHQIVNISHYLGTPTIFPDVLKIEQMIDTYTDQPVAFSLDVGVIASGETLPVEVNDCIALGAYGLRSVRYAQMIRDRWREMRNNQ